MENPIMSICNNKTKPESWRVLPPAAAQQGTTPQILDWDGPDDFQHHPSHTFEST